MNLCFVVFLTSVATEKVFESVDKNVHFKKVGEAIILIDRADIVTDIDLAPIDKLIQAACDWSEKQATGDHLRLSRSLRVRFEMVCRDLTVHWDSVVNQVGGLAPLEERQARFIVTAIVSALAAGVATELWGAHEDREKVKALAQEQGRLVRLVEANEARANVNGQHLHELAQLLEKEARSSRNREDALDKAMGVLGSFLLATSEVAHFSSVLSEILVHRRASPALFLPGALTGHLHALRRQARQHDLELGILKEHEVWKLPISFGTFSSRTLRMVIHVPLRRREEEYDILQWLAVPQRLEPYDGYGVAACPAGNTHLLISKDRSRFFAVQRAALDGWSQGPDYWLISSPTLVRLEDKASCLWGLYKGRRQQILDACEVRKPKDGIHTFQLDEGRIIVAATKPARIDVWCGQVWTGSASFVGLRMITAQPGCRLKGDDFILEIPRREEKWAQHVRAPALDLKVEQLNQLPQMRAGNFTLPAWARGPAPKVLHSGVHHPRPPILTTSPSSSLLSQGMEWVLDHPGWATALACVLLCGMCYTARALKAKLVSCHPRSSRSRTSNSPARRSADTREGISSDSDESNSRGGRRRHRVRPCRRARARTPTLPQTPPPTQGGTRTADSALPTIEVPAALLELLGRGRRNDDVSNASSPKTSGRGAGTPSVAGAAGGGTPPKPALLGGTERETRTPSPDPTWIERNGVSNHTPVNIV